MVWSFFVGLGPGGLDKVIKKNIEPVLPSTCLPGSNHGGHVPNPGNAKFKMGGPYDKQNLTTFRGGSGGDGLFFQYLFLLFLFFNLSFFLASHADAQSWP